MQSYKILIALISGLFISQFPACSQRNYDAENEMLECFYQTHQEMGIDMKDKTDRIEDIFISNGVLKDNSGESYIIVFQRISETGNLSDNDKSIAEQLNTLGEIPSGVFCNNSALVTETLEKYPDSKLLALSKHLSDIDAINELSPTSQAKKILGVLDAKDMENEYYRAFSLLFFASMIKIPTTLSRTLPQMPQNESESGFDSANLLTISITKDNRIFAAGSEISLSELKPLVRRFLLETSGKKEIDLPLLGRQMKLNGVISIKNNQGTSYNTYINVQDEIAAAFRDIREEYAMKFFGKSFNQLSKEQASEIAKMVPLAVSESEPTK